MHDAVKSREFFEQVRREHDRLRELLGSMHRVLADRHEGGDEVAAMFDSLCQRLDSHFHTEDEGELFEQIIDHAPHLADRANATRAAHDGLLNRIQEIAEQAHAKTGSDQWWQQLSEEFQHFGTELMQHENQEGELIQEAYGDDIGSKD